MKQRNNALTVAELREYLNKKHINDDGLVVVRIPGMGLLTPQVSDFTETIPKLGKPVEQYVVFDMQQQ